ncbi:MAG: HAMP domain-containing histidine kinase [Sinobacteraceae bacterium]|nr:HAMP domain-containing histidine kinase [Nevskiaceae bacterium]
MFRTRLFRTSSFRLALVYAALTGISFVILLGVIFLSTTRFMRHQIDDSVTSEINEIFADSQSRSLDDVRVVVQALSRHPAGFHYLLEDSSGHVRAGNLPAVDPEEGVREWDAAPHHHGHEQPYASLRGRGILLPDGGYLFVGWSTHQLIEMEEMVVGAFSWGLAACIVLALAGGLVMSGRLMSRIETVSNTSRNIIGEDLRQRLPVTQAGDELDHLAVSINTMLDRIQALMEDLRQVTTNIAHDLRTPLTRLRQRLELASLREVDVETVRQTLSSTVHEIDSILSIFSALLHIAQLEAGSRRAGFKAVDLSGLLATSAELYRPMAEENGQTLSEDIEESLTVQGERELLMQLFANLIENALRHSPRGSSVAIVARKTNELVTVSVVDNGPGIPENMRTKVLQRFVRLESSRTTPGSGLGLSLANAIVKAHEATLELSDARPGLRATVSLKAA